MDDLSALSHVAPPAVREAATHPADGGCPTPAWLGLWTPEGWGSSPSEKHTELRRGRADWELPCLPEKHHRGGIETTNKSLTHFLPNLIYLSFLFSLIFSLQSLGNFTLPSLFCFLFCIFHIFSYYSLHLCFHLYCFIYFTILFHLYCFMLKLYKLMHGLHCVTL